MKQDTKDLLAALPKPLNTTKLTNVSKDTAIFFKAEVTTHVYLLVSGKVAVQNSHADGNIYLISYLTAGTFLGDLEVMSDNLVNATTLIAHTDCSVMKFSVADFEKALAYDKGFLLMVSKKLAKKMYKECYRLGDSLYRKGIDKLRDYLLQAYSENASGDLLFLNKTRQMIADEIGVNVKTINRAVLSLSKQNSIELEKGKIRVGKMHYEAMQTHLSS